MARARSVESAIRQRLIQQDKAVREELALVAEIHAELLVSKHEAVVRDWTRRPFFKPFVYVSKRQIISDVTVTGKHAKLYLWTDKGTKPHLIQPKQKGGHLTFQTGYSARTKPVAKFNVGTGRKFGAWRRVRVVHHPGTKARKFSETFNKETLPDLRREISNAIRRGLRRRKG
jgi:hypothetical protein